MIKQSRMKRELLKEQYEYFHPRLNSWIHDSDTQAELKRTKHEGPIAGVKRIFALVTILAIGIVVAVVIQIFNVGWLALTGGAIAVVVGLGMNQSTKPQMMGLLDRFIMILLLFLLIWRLVPKVGSSS